MLEKLIEAVENWDLTRGEARQQEEAAMVAPPEGLVFVGTCMRVRERGREGGGGRCSHQFWLPVVFCHRNVMSCKSVPTLTGRISFFVVICFN